MKYWYHRCNCRVSEIAERLELVLATIADLDVAIAQLDSDVKALIAKEPVPVDVQPQVDAVNAVDAEVQGALNPPA